MTVAYSLVLLVEMTSAAATPNMDFLAFRLLTERPPEIHAGPDGGTTYSYRMRASELVAARELAERSVAVPTPEGLMSCLSALAQEALELGLTQASWTIDLATQMIRLQQDGPKPGTTPNLT